MISRGSEGKVMGLGWEERGRLWDWDLGGEVKASLWDWDLGVEQRESLLDWDMGGEAKANLWDWDFGGGVMGLRGEVRAGWLVVLCQTGSVVQVTKQK